MSDAGENNLSNSGPDPTVPVSEPAATSVSPDIHREQDSPPREAGPAAPASENPQPDSGHWANIDEPEPDSGNLATNDETEVTTSSVIEAVLFAADEPIAPARLAEIVQAAGVKEVKQFVENLNQKYKQMNCAFRIESIAGGLQMLTLPAYKAWLGKLIKIRNETKLTPAALETLAIIAYKQPIIRIDVESIRGVACGEMIRQLCDKGLVKVVGRAEVLGRPMLYGTTKYFLQLFGLESLKDLPSAEGLKKP